MKTFIKSIKSATTKEQLKQITKDALKTAGITMKQYDKLIAYAVCREIELGTWEYLNAYPDKETALKVAQKEFKIKY
jgi:hypothetical protein